jgi:Uma2 family endonuclease
MSAARSYAGYYTIAEWEKWHDQWELIDGAPYSMSPSPTGGHQRINTKILQELGILLKKCSKCEAIMFVDWVINEDTIVQPDVSILCKEFITDRLHFAPTVIFEILSPSTTKKDRTVKFDLYQSQGVRYYILVDTKSELAEIYLLQNEKYILQNFSAEFNFDLGECNVKFDFSKIWS